MFVGEISEIINYYINWTTL